MKRLLSILLIVLLAGCTQVITSSTPSPDAKSDVSPTPVTAKLPENWERFKDNVVGYSIGYPENWYTVPAVSLDAESQIYSYDYTKARPVQGISSDKLKIAVNRFRSGMQPEPPAPSSILETKEITVGGEEATWMKVSHMTNAINVWLMHDNTQYIISAYSADSIHLETFKSMLDTFKFEPALELNQPQPLSTVSSPMSIRGEMTGTWFFEGQMMSELRTVQGKTLGTTPLKAAGEWMTEDNVPFAGEMSFTVPSGVTQGELLIKSDNPSGLPENEHIVRVPVNF